MRVRTLVFIAALLLSAATSRECGAHGFAPSLLDLTEAADGHVEVAWKTPRTALFGIKLQPVLPVGCEMLGLPDVTADEATTTSRWALHCPGLTGQSIEVKGLGDAKTDVLVRIRLADGRLVRGVLSYRQPALTVPARESPWRVFTSYLGLGFEHILLGFDHLAFVFGLMLLVGGGRRLVATVTAFTLGHSVTLSLVALGLATFPAAAVEVAIAVSILVLAAELTGERKGSLLRRYPWAIAGIFGLLHGFGFAGALIEAGLPSTEIPLALFSFNVGIEMGQLVFVFALLSLWLAARQTFTRLSAWGTQAPAYCIGTMAAFWSIERIAAML